MLPIVPIALTAAVGVVAGAAAVRWWLDLLRRSGSASQLNDEAEAACQQDAAHGSAPEWLRFCPACRVHLAPSTASRCRLPDCGFPRR
ncbi:MAG: hypothetical protein MUE49_07230 [Rhodospirillales bacterium]|jgi:hypothetical protein|nr:hypothetical protein [Rhodospirillales bacterium]